MLISDWELDILTWKVVWAKLKAPLLSVAFTITADVCGKINVIEFSGEFGETANSIPSLVLM